MTNTSKRGWSESRELFVLNFAAIISL